MSQLICRLVLMNQELFVNALSSLLVVSDCAEFLDTRRSFIIDSLCKLGCPKDAAVSYLMTCGAVEQKRAEQYINEIEHQGLSDEFEQWSNQDEVIEERKYGILATLSLGIRALNHPHRFHKINSGLLFPEHLQSLKVGDFSYKLSGHRE